MRVFNIVQAFALVVIAIVLVTEQWMTYVRPARSLQANSDEYLRLIVECELAKTGLEELENDASGLNDFELNNLFASAQIELVACHEREKLRQDLLGAGVSFASLAQIELVAKEQDGIPIHRLVDRYTREP